MPLENDGAELASLRPKITRVFDRNLEDIRGQKKTRAVDLDADQQLAFGLGGRTYEQSIGCFSRTLSAFNAQGNKKVTQERRLPKHCYCLAPISNTYTYNDTHALTCADTPHVARTHKHTWPMDGRKAQLRTIRRRQGTTYVCEHTCVLVGHICSVRKNCRSTAAAWTCPSRWGCCSARCWGTQQH